MRPAGGRPGSACSFCSSCWPGSTPCSARPRATPSSAAARLMRSASARPSRSRSGRGSRCRAPRKAWFAVGTERSGRRAGRACARAGRCRRTRAAPASRLTAERRGTASLRMLWLRWRGPLGLVWKQRARALDQDVLIVPDIRPVRDKGIQMANREALFGQKAQLQVGEGAEFEALADYPPGHGPPRDRLEAVRPPRQPDRQGISHRAQQQYRHGARCRPGDVRAVRRPAAHRPRGLGGAAHRLCRAEGRRPGRLLRLRFQAARVEQADRRPARLLDAAAGRRRHRLFGERDQLHARHLDARRPASTGAR